MARNSPTPDETITDHAGNHQLITRWAPFGDGFNFDSLVWRSRENDAWEEKIVITREAFEAGTDRRRWVSSLHSFDPPRGTAIIKVAEGNLPRGADCVHYTYSWREWDLVHNREVRFIRTCESPYENFDTREV